MQLRISTLLLLVVLLFIGYYYFKCRPQEDEDSDNESESERENYDGENVTPLQDDFYEISADTPGVNLIGEPDFEPQNMTPIENILPQLDVSVPKRYYATGPPNTLAGNVRPDNVNRVSESYTMLPQSF